MGLRSIGILQGLFSLIPYFDPVNIHGPVKLTGMLIPQTLALKWSSASGSGELQDHPLKCFGPPNLIRARQVLNMLRGGLRKSAWSKYLSEVPLTILLRISECREISRFLANHLGILRGIPIRINSSNVWAQCGAQTPRTVPHALCPSWHS